MISTPTYPHLHPHITPTLKDEVRVSLFSPFTAPPPTLYGVWGGGELGRGGEVALSVGFKD